MPMRRHPLREHGLTGTYALVIAASFLGACATRGSEMRDESAERIEAIIGSGQASEPIPDGIMLGPDAPPLSGSSMDESLALVDEPLPSEARTPRFEEAPSVTSGRREPPLYPFAREAPSGPCQQPPHGAILPAPVPLACLLNPGAIQYRLQPRPGGSIPGLLP